MTARRSPLDNLAVVSADLVRTEAGRIFIDALAVVVEDARETLVMAPPEHLQYAQGVARQGTVLLRTLRNAPEKARKIIEAEQQAAAQAEARSKT